MEEQTDAERRRRQESNLVKSEWDVMFLNVQRVGHSQGEKENGDGARDAARQSDEEWEKKGERQRKSVRRK